jgi:hypothetical protein
MRPGGALTGDPLDLIAKFESGGRNIMQGVVPTGGGYNPSVGRVTGPSTAQGPWQITNTTWRGAAPKAGVDVTQYPTAMSAPVEIQRRVAQQLYNDEGFKPWAPYNSRLAAAIPNWTPSAASAGSPSAVDLATGEGAFAVPSYGEAPPASPDTVVAQPQQGPAATPASYDPTGGSGRSPIPPNIKRNSRGEPYNLDDAPGQQISAAQVGPDRLRQLAQANAGSSAGAPAGGGAPAAQAPEAMMRQEIGSGLQKMQQITPPSVYGRMGLSGIVQQIEKAMPGADPLVKMMTLEYAQKLLAPDARMQWELYKQQHDETFQKELIDYRHRLTMTEPTAGGKLLQDPQGDLHEWRPGQPIPPGYHESKGEGAPTLVESGGKQFWAKYGHPLEPVEVPGGGPISKVGTTKPASSLLDEQQAKYWAKVIGMGGSLPPGLRRSGIVEQVMKEVGSAGGDPGQFIAKHSEVQANTSSLRNMTKMADAAISFEALASKNFDVAMNLAPDAIPTELGPFFNQWIEQGDTMLGNPEVPRYVAAIITGANEYAKVMSGSTGTAASTVDSRREAREMFSPYLSLPQISQVIAVAKADMANRENTLKEQVDTIKSRLGGKEPAAAAPAVMPNVPRKGSSAAPATEEPLPEWAKPYRDGTGFEIEGVVKIKKGNKLVVAPGAVKTAP